MGKLTDSELDSIYRDMLDDSYGTVSVAGLEYETSRVLAEIDPTAYRCGFNDWLDSELRDDVLCEVNGEYYTDRGEALEDFIEANRADILADLTSIVTDLQRTMKADPAAYTQHGCEEPSIDIRLCVDLGHNASWIIRTGDSSYDQRHSEYCAADCVGLETSPADLLELLLNEVQS